MNKDLEYSSALAPYINSLLADKRSMGYSYDNQAYLLKKFDEYWMEQGIESPVITMESLEKWMVQRDTECRQYRDGRISAVRQLALHMNASGLEAYIPRGFFSKNKRMPHLFSDGELLAFFSEVDSYAPIAKSEVFDRMAHEYRILFRMYYCCGLRRTEACRLRTRDVDLKGGILTILRSKGDKDRNVYLPDDLCLLCARYLDYLRNVMGTEPYWFFPSKDPDKPLPGATVDRRFNKFWGCTAYAESCEKKPTVHCFRHTYVVKRMNLWMEQGLSLDVMMPYLSKYLGHKGADGTFYYYHSVKETYRVIREKDTIANAVIPEVRRNG